MQTGWLDRQRQGCWRPLAAGIRSVVTDYVLPPIAAVVVDYAEPTANDWQNDIPDGRRVDLQSKRRQQQPQQQQQQQQPTDRFVASKPLQNHKLVDIYQPVDRPAYAVLQNSMQSVDGISSRLHCRTARGYSYYSTLITGEISYTVNDGPPKRVADFNSYDDAVLSVLPSDDERMLVVVDDRQVLTIDTLYRTNVRLTDSADVVQTVFYRSPIVPDGRILILLHRSAIWFVDVKYCRAFRVVRNDDLVYGSVACLPNGILMITVVGLSSIWFMDPRHALQPSPAIDQPDLTAIVGVDGLTRSVYYAQADGSVQQVVLPAYVFSASTADDENKHPTKPNDDVLDLLSRSDEVDDILKLVRRPACNSLIVK